MDYEWDRTINNFQYEGKGQTFTWSDGKGYIDGKRIRPTTYRPFFEDPVPVLSWWHYYWLVFKRSVKIKLNSIRMSRWLK
jgi:hypothetical protein